MHSLYLYMCCVNILLAFLARLESIVEEKNRIIQSQADEIGR